MSQYDLDAQDRLHLLESHRSLVTKAWSEHSAVMGQNGVIFIVDLTERRYHPILFSAGISTESIMRQITTCKAANLRPAAVFMMPVNAAKDVAQKIGSPRAAEMMGRPLPMNQMQVFLIASCGSQLARIPAGPTSPLAN